MARTKQGTGEPVEYINLETGEKVGAYAGTEQDKVYRDDPDFDIVGRRPSTANKEEAAKASIEGDGSEPPAKVDPNEHSRPELNQLATEAGVESPESLDNKGAVADAINAAREEAAKASIEGE
jgi:hypothetical protein